jgi:hypothetical protein
LIQSLLNTCSEVSLFRSTTLKHIMTRTILLLLIGLLHRLPVFTQPCDPPNISGNAILCAGQSITLTADPGFISYIWSNGSTSQSSVVDTPGVYQVTVVCPNGNAAFASANVLGFTSGVQAGGSGVICAGQCASLFVLLSNGSNGPYTIIFALSTGGTQTFTVNPSGGGAFTILSVCPTETTTYTLQSVTNDLGCVAFINSNLTAATITVNNGLSVSINGPDNICPGQTAVLTANPPGQVAYQWSNASGSPTTTINQPGNYTVTVTAAGGCSGTASISVAATPPPTVSFTALNPDICPGGCQNIEANFSGNAPFILNGQVLSGASVISSFNQTFNSNTGILQICLPPNIQGGPIQVTALSLADANCTCQ